MSLFKKLLFALKSEAVSQTEWDEIRAQLITSDLGSGLVDQLITKLKKEKPQDVYNAITNELLTWLSDKSRNIVNSRGSLCTILIVGVNGTGKTTSVAKLANFLHLNGNSVLIAAADTFRAAAVDQIKTWANRIGIEVVTGAEKSDPSSVVFNSVSKAKELNAKYLIIDTAGRLHNKQNLMDELAKIVRVIEKQSQVDEILFVIDGTTGQNGITQAKTFIDSIGVTGFIVTKLDGSTKGGIALAIEKATGLPIKFVGSGEGIADLQVFDPPAYIASLLG
jgi:fused signal recognition particle receptor